MDDSTQTLPMAADDQSNNSCTKLTASELNNETGLMDPFVSTEKLEEFDDESLLYPSRAKANTISDPLSCFDYKFSKSDGESGLLVLRNRSPSRVDNSLSLFASSFSSRFEDGYEKPSTIVGAGLANLVNTCFFNAVLQCFTHSVLVVQGLYTLAHPTPCDCDEQFCLICALRLHIERSLSPTAKIISPWKFIFNLSYFSSSFRRYQQEDAHEFLQCFLDRLESSLNDLKTKDDGLTSETDNLVKHVFGGRVISKLRCCNCNHISDTYEPFGDLSLEIEDVTSLSTALESFTKVEHIEDEEMKFTCDQCKQKVSIDKQLMLDQIPLICAFHLKRFKNYGPYLEKIDKHVEFPLELELQPYTFRSQSNNVDLKHELYAVVVHETLGSNSGHYYCYIRTAPDTWYKFDDSKVTSVSQDCVLSQEAYILFYAQQGTPWFSTFMETYKPSFTPNLLTTSPKSVLENVDPPNTHSHDTTAATDRSITQPADVAPLKPIVDALEEIPSVIFKQHSSIRRIEVQKNTCFTYTTQSVDVAQLKPIVNVAKERYPLSFKENGSNDRVEVQKNTRYTSTTQSADAMPFVNVVQESYPLSFKEYGSNNRNEVQKSTCSTPTNDSRTIFDFIDETASPSTVARLDVSDDEDPEVVFATKPKKLKTAKREKNNKVEDTVKREAMKQCKRLPGIRRVLLMAAIRNSVLKKSKKNVVACKNKR